MFSSFVALNCVNIRNWQTRECLVTVCWQFTDSLLTVCWQFPLSAVTNITAVTAHISTLYCTWHLALPVHYVLWMKLVLSSHYYFDKVNRLVFVIGKQSVFCEVKAELLCIAFRIWFQISGGREEVQVFSGSVCFSGPVCQSVRFSLFIHNWCILFLFSDLTDHVNSL